MKSTQTLNIIARKATVIPDRTPGFESPSAESSAYHLACSCLDVTLARVKGLAMFGIPASVLRKSRARATVKSHGDDHRMYSTP